MPKQSSARGVLINAVSPGPIKTDGRFLYSQDEGWNRSQWADAVIPEAYLAWVEDGVLCDDPEAVDSQVTVMLSGEVFAQVEEVGKALGGRGVGAAFRRLIAYSLPSGGKV